MKKFEDKIPVSIITGFLGAGKTSLLNQLVTQTDKKLALIINEFGDLGIDGDLVVDAEDQILELNNGCLCCTVKGDLTKILLKLKARRGTFDQVVIETTGLADPAPVAELIYFDHNVNKSFYIDGIVTVFDCVNAEEVLKSPEGEKQVLYADKILLSKQDLLTQDFSTEQLQSLNPFADFANLDHGKCEKALELLSLGGFRVDLEKMKTSGHKHSHMSSVALEKHGELNEGAFRSWIGSVLFDTDMVVYRMKGLVKFTGKGKNVVFQSVHRLYEDAETSKDYGIDNKIVFIGEKLDEQLLKKGFEKCFYN